MELADGVMKSAELNETRQKEKAANQKRGST
jgi:hypothetical protein